VEVSVLTGGFQFYVGIDWATEAHQICVINGSCDLIAERVVEHNGSGLAQFLDWLTQLCHGAPQSAAVAIEIPRGAVVESLIERGFCVFAINPKQLDRFRDRHTVAGAKDDRRDAFVLADSLRTDQPLFKRVQVDEPMILHLRELSRLDDDLRQDHTRLLNQFHEQLARYYPQLLALSPVADEPWLWDLLEIAALPEQGAKLTASRIEKLLRQHRIRRWDAKQVREKLHEPALRLAPGAAAAASEHALFVLSRLRLVHQQRLEVGRRIQAVLEELAAPGDHADKHRDVTLLLSLPGVGRVVAATMLAEASQPLAERDYHALRAYGGTAPVTKQSGKKRSVLMRQACNCRVRHALYHWARVSSQVEPRSREQYQRLRQAGHSHGRALRGVADRLLAMLVAILKTGLPYDPALRHPQQLQKP
jgi:transposase